MNTNGRLNDAYKNAKRIPLDSQSKFVFFSDCHRGDDSVSDEFARNQTLVVAALNYYYQNGFTYVEVGDGDDLWSHRKLQYIRTAHTDVFTLLKKFYKKRRFYMLYGNHNICLSNPKFVAKNYYYYYDEYTGEKEPLFYGLKPLESIVLKEVNTGQEILVLHGHQGDILNDQLWFLSMIGVRYFWKFMHVVGIRNPASPAKNQHKRHHIEKNYSTWIRQHGKMLICGHTHRMKFPRKGEVPYFNIGSCVQTKGITTIEIVRKKITLVEWRVRCDEEGMLYAARRVIRGPVPVRHWR